MNRINVFLDSGAFSAYTKGVSIDIHDYIKFIKENEDNIVIYANLDVIGDAEGTWRNQLIMEKAGLNPIPCFHIKEDFSYLKRYVEKYEYIALGGIAGLAKNKPLLIKWLNECWNIICDKDGYPRTKVHGFAVTTLDLMFRYPWYSVDSTSWVLTGRFGSIYVPQFGRKSKKYIYDKEAFKICVSNQSPSQKENMRHFVTLSSMEQEKVLGYIHDKGYRMGKSSYKIVPAGYQPDESKGERWYNKVDANSLRECINEFGVFVDPSLLSQGKTGDGRPFIEIVEEIGICNDYKQRDAMNILYFTDLEREMPPYPHRWEQRGVIGFGV